MDDLVKLRTQVEVRWMIRRDLPDVMSIEESSFDFPWTEEDFLQTLRCQNCIGMVAETGNREIAGFVIYELLKSALHILNLAVAPGFRRQGVGYKIIERLVRKLHQQRRELISLEVRDANLSAHLFFRELGFVATDIFPGYYEEEHEDAYRFEYELPLK